MKPIVIKSEIFLEHETKKHPESKNRLIHIYKEIEDIKDKLIFSEPKEAKEEDILKIHTLEHLQKVKEASKNQEPLDLDTPTSKKSFLAAKYAVGAGLKAIDLINQRVSNLAFCLVRPPGHHATPNKAMGFCLFNNIAISAKYAQSKGYQKVFIIDFDVHHGNGTQDCFYSDSSVFYFSTHQAFTYPGSGNPDEMGEGKGVGYTFNYPLMPNSTDKELLEVYQDILPKIVNQFNPDIILVSAGYDLHESDPLASLDITYDGVVKMVNSILQLKQKTPKIFFLEGGYDVHALAINVKNTLNSMIKNIS